MMKINTLHFGELEINEESIFTFESGIPGFKNEKKFTLINLPDNPTFQFLQSIENENLCFVVTSPYLFYRDYEFKLDEGTIEQVSVEKPEDVTVYSVVTLQEPFEKSTLNLQAPLLFNAKNRKAKQMVLNDKRYRTKHPLRQESEEVNHASTNTQSR
jgi:flagellar assembly factor FliW